MSRRVFQFKCEDCGTVQDEDASAIEQSREMKKREETLKALGEEFIRRDWTYCLSCGGYSFRVWNPPAITFSGSGFTKGI